MSLILAVVLSTMVTGAPCTPVLKNDTATRLAAAIVKTNPRAQPYARRLATAIVREAKRHRIPVDLLAAVGWAESYSAAPSTPPPVPRDTSPSPNRNRPRPSGPYASW